MTTYNRNRRLIGLTDRHMRIAMGAQTRRIDQSTWKEEAMAALMSPSEERAPATTTREVELVSALRQPRSWDLRDEPRGVSVLPRLEPLESLEPAEVEAPKPRQLRQPRPVRVQSQWQWWEIIAPTAITLGAIWQLIWGIS